MSTGWHLHGTKLSFLSNRLYGAMAQPLFTILVDTHISSELLTNLDNSYAVPALYRGWRDPQRLGWPGDTPVPNPSVKYRCGGLLVIPCGQRFRNDLFPPSHNVVRVVPLGNGFMGLREMSLPHATQTRVCHGLVAGRGHNVGMWGNGQWAVCSLWGHVWATNNYICPEMGSRAQPPSCSNIVKF